MEVLHLESWCWENNLLLNSEQTEELVVDFRRKQQGDIHPLWINRSEVERVDSSKYLGVTITQNLSWSLHIQRTVKRPDSVSSTSDAERLEAPPPGAQELVHLHHREHLEWENHYLDGQLHQAGLLSPEKGGPFSRAGHQNHPL